MVKCPKISQFSLVTEGKLSVYVKRSDEVVVILWTSYIPLINVFRTLPNIQDEAQVNSTFIC